MISIVVPTYREAENLPLLAEAVDATFTDLGGAYELLFVDDDSRDGSEEICAELVQRFPARVLVRKGERGLATAVVHGITIASGEIIVVMDADLSHPPSAIPQLLEPLLSGESDFVLGSRYVEGGSIHEDWTLLRKLNSVIASHLARPLFPVRDPMSGFFAFRRSEMPDPARLTPVGYKIGLEIFVKGDFATPREVPIHFERRRHGESKLSFKQQLDFLRHLCRLYFYQLGAGKGS
ncbi:MAG: polyprenol monophosphomannose synthase [Polyangiales bacterium]